ncbi:SCO family protein [Stutzerimonas stutzeri]|nr:SCO family protein [Stutzerimonas stutzeri]
MFQRSLALLALACVMPSFASDRDTLLDQANILLLPRERAIPEFELIDQDGQPFTSASLQQRWHILFFGFTACPDICPTTLSDMRRVLSQLPAEIREGVQLVLISADPARDTPQQLKTYLNHYRAGFIGVTGDMDQLQKVSKALGLPFVPASETDGDYSVSHSGNLALVAPNGSLRGHIRAPLKLDGLKEMLPQVLERKR